MVAIWAIGGFVVAGAVGAWALRANEASLEQPRYQVVAQSKDYEVRKYDPYIVAETQTRGTFETSGSEAFQILAGYIFGKNQSGEKMSMTAPVESNRESGTSMKMTSPVLSAPGAREGSNEDGIYRYRFVMESKFTMNTLPQPLDTRIQIKQIEPRLVAVRRYSGSWGQSAYQKNEALLEKALKRDGRRPVGDPEFARYNAPFTPSFLRRNEVLIEIADLSSPDS